MYTTTTNNTNPVYKKKQLQSLATGKRLPKFSKNFRTFKTTTKGPYFAERSPNFERMIERSADKHSPHRREYVKGLEIIEARIREFLVAFPDKEAWYRTYYIPKRSGGVREISAPIDELKLLQADMIHAITYGPDHYFPFIHAHTCAYAYVPGRGIKDAMLQHKLNNSNWFLKMDIKDFFPSCTCAVLEQALSKIYPFCMFPQTFINAIILISTWHGHLPQGSVASPFFSNMIMLPIDFKITQQTYNLDRQTVIYTRYADDMLISAYKRFSKEELLSIVRNVLHEEYPDMNLNEEKTRFQSRAGKNFNLGIMLNKDNNLTIGHKRKDNLRAQLYDFCKRYKENNGNWPTVKETQNLVGQLSYLNYVETGEANRYIRKYNRKFGMDFKAAVKLILNEPQIV